MTNKLYPLFKGGKFYEENIKQGKRIWSDRMQGGATSSYRVFKEDQPHCSKFSIVFES